MPQRQWKSRDTLGLAIVVIIGLVAILLFFRGPQRTAEISAGDCVRPEFATGLSDRELELAAVSISSVSVGRFHASGKERVVKLLTDAASDNLIVEYLTCVAIRRGDIEKGNSDQIDYLRRFWSFMQSKPSPEQVEVWQRHNTMPPSKSPRPEGVLETTGIETTSNGGVLRITQTSGQDFGIINAGDQPFLFWLDNFPSNEVGLSPDGANAISVEPGKTVTFRASVLWASQVVRRRRQFSVETNLPDGTGHVRRNVTIEVDRRRFESELKKLAVAVAQDLTGTRLDGATKKGDLPRLLASLTAIPTAGAAPLDAPRRDAQRYLLTRTRLLVARTLDLHSDFEINVATGAFFEAVNWPELAAQVFADIPTDQRMLLPRGLIPRTSLLEASPNAYRTPMDALATAYGSTEESVSSLQTYKASMFQTPFTLMNRSLAFALADWLMAFPDTASLGHGLKGDLLAAQGDYQSALASYNAAISPHNTNSLVLRRDAVAMSLTKEREVLSLKDVASAHTTTLIRAGGWEAFGGRSDDGKKVCGISTEGGGRWLGFKYFEGQSYVTIQLSKDTWTVDDGAVVQVVMQFDDETPWSAEATAFHMKDRDAALVSAVGYKEVTKWISELAKSDTLYVRFPKEDTIDDWQALSAPVKVIETWMICMSVMTGAE
jgi:hypothetical protein